MVALEDPITHGITVRNDTDHSWKFRRKDMNGAVLIPTAARAQIRSESTGVLWHDLTCTIDEDGWIIVTLPNAEATLAEWGKRDLGDWDLIVTYSGKDYRWVEGPVLVSIGATE